MLNEKDIYTHLKNGGSIEDLKKALDNEISAAQDRIIKEKDAEIKEKELAAKINKARTTAHKAMKSYLTLVNPKVDDKMISIALDTLEGFIMPVISAKKCGSGELKSFSSFWEDIFNGRFPF